MERELRALAQTQLLHIQEVGWQDLRLAVVAHLEAMEEQDTLLHARIPPQDVCQHILHNKPCPKWTDGIPHAEQHGARSLCRSWTMATPSGFGCHVRPFRGAKVCAIHKAHSPAQIRIA